MTQRIHPEIQDLAVPIGELATYPGNARQGDIGAICESLRINGQYRPVVANRRTGQVLAGNHTLKAASALGWDEIAVTWVDVAEDRAKKIVLADNRANDLASYDDWLLLAALDDLPDLEGALYDDDDVNRLRAQLERLETAGGKPEEFPSYDQDIPTEHECPKCGYQWSGNS